MQTCLEVKGIESRNNLITRNDYTRNEVYSEIHPDAKTYLIEDSDKPWLGKGTGHGGHLHSIPDCTAPSTISYQNFDTENAGGLYDIEGRNGVGGRNFLKNISMFNEANQYTLNYVDTTANIADGQIVIPG